ncbi:MAG: CapA family protein [Clostridia bacterium]|nr:CapA family protein [Clostridia bacterium]
MKNGRFITAILLGAACIAILCGCGAKPETSPEPDSTPEADVSPSPEPTPITATITVAGDIVVHQGMNDEAATDSGYDYTQIFEDVAPYIADSDLALCCLETTFPASQAVSGYPMFKSPGQLAYDLKSVGFDLIATASNHCMDSYQSGLIDTLDVLDDAGLDHVGTYRTQEERDANSGIVVEDLNGITIAFLDYTYGTNGMPLTGFEFAANVYNKDYLTTLTDINYDFVAADMAAAKALDTDFIAVIVHWGNEYITTRQTWQTTFADFLFEQGADFVLGGHPHVPEPMEIRTVTDENGNEKQGFLCYCLGNLMSCMNDRYTDLTAILQLTVEKDPVTGQAKLNSVGYVPVAMVDAWDNGISPGWRYRLLDIHSAIDEYDSGDTRGYMSQTLYNNLTQGLDDMHSICGEDFDIWGQWNPKAAA